MAQLYTIEEQTTTGWHVLVKERHLTKQECTTKYNDFIASGINPNDLRIVRDDL